MFRRRLSINFYRTQSIAQLNKVWRAESRYQAGKKQLAAYLRTEGVTEGDYIVFDHREKPEPKVETETINGFTIRSYIIPVMQEMPSQVPNAPETQ